MFFCLRGDCFRLCHTAACDATPACQAPSSHRLESRVCDGEFLKVSGELLQPRLTSAVYGLA